MVGGSYFANFGALALLRDFGMAVGLLQQRGLMCGLARTDVQDRTVAVLFGGVHPAEPKGLCHSPSHGQLAA